MSALVLRKTDSTSAQASRLLGVGLSLAFSVQGVRAELILLPAVPGVVTRPEGQWLNTGIGPMLLSDADAVLSLLGETPVVFQGEYQPWYWQLISQRLSPDIAPWLAPLQPASHTPPKPDACCRLQVRLADQLIHATLSCDPETLMRLLTSAPWRPHQTALPEDWPLLQPLQIGELELSLEQLTSLRPGDVLLPSHTRFDSDGNGSLALAGQQWAVRIETHTDDTHNEPPIDSHAHTLFLRISHEEAAHHGQ